MAVSRLNREYRSLLKELADQSIDQLTYDAMLVQMLTVGTETVLRTEQRLINILARNRIEVPKSVRHPYSRFQKLVDPDVFKRQVIAEVQADIDKLSGGTIKQQQRAMKKLTRPRKRIVEVTKADGDLFAKRLEKRRIRQVKKGDLEYGENLTQQENQIAQRLQTATIRMYRTFGIKIITSNLIQSLLIQVIKIEGIAQYSLNSNMFYAKFVDGYTRFTGPVKSLCRSLTGTELIINFV